PCSSVEYRRRRRSALWVTVSLLALSLVVLTVGLISATRTDNVPVAGYYPGIILSFGAFLGIVGIHLVENRRPMLLAAIIFISIGVIASFFCAIVDGIIASEFIDIRPLQEDMCDFYSSGPGYAYDSYYTEASTINSTFLVFLRVLFLTKVASETKSSLVSYKSCKLKLRSNTCYCCYLYNCESTEYHTQYYEFTGVSSCWDVIHLHRLLWASVVLNVIGLFLGIVAAAILGAYKDLVSTASERGCPLAATPHLVQSHPAHAHLRRLLSLGTDSPRLPQLSNTDAAGPGPGPASNEASAQPQPHGAGLDAGGYTLTPNAPALYGPSYGPFEKPPPYAC
uniref:Transmembrane protein 255B n=1 Tax=Tetraodon nigroviridis TaxID=99883 RepID=H3CVN8_TETNG